MCATCVPWSLPLSFLIALAIVAYLELRPNSNVPSSSPVGFVLQPGSLEDVSMKCFNHGAQYNNIISLCTRPVQDLMDSFAYGSCRYSQGIQFYEMFNTEFTFVMAPRNTDYENESGVIHRWENIDGMALVISDSPEFAFQGAPGGYLGIGFPQHPASSNQSTYNYSVLAVEFDVFPNSEFGDPLYDHVGIDVHGMNSSHTAMAGYHIETTPCSGNYTFVPMNLSGVGQIQAWVELEDNIWSGEPHLLVSISPMLGIKPPIPLLNASLDPSTVDLLYGKEQIYVGMSASEGKNRLAGLAYILDWSFNTSGPTVELFPGRMKPPSCPGAKTVESDDEFLTFLGQKPDESDVKFKNVLETLKILFIETLKILFIVVSFTAMVLGGLLWLRQARKRLHKEFEHILIQGNRPVKFSLKDLKSATLGFSEDRALGKGAYGTVYKGILSNNTIVAVKKFSAKHQAADRDAASSSFVQELKVIARLRHMNLVRLLGWCHEKEELMLVYEFMPNGSLDHYLFSKGRTPASESILSWNQRFQILKGVARALAYLHDEWKQLVVHRDVKVSNVLLDAEFNGRLGDFGLARLYDHKEAWNPKTTNVAGTRGYIAPEIFLNPKFIEKSKGNFTEKSDVYAFGMVALQMVSGRKIYDPALEAEEQELLEWIHFMLNCGKIMDVIDGRLGEKFESKQALDVLHIGLCCTNIDPNLRPRMRQTLQMLEGEAFIPPVQVQSSPPEAIFLPISGVGDDDLDEVQSL